MYVIRNKKTKALIHMANSVPGVDLKPEQVLREFDPKTMEMGRYHEQYLPEDFTIEDGVVKELAKPAPKKAKSDKAAAQELKELRALKLMEASRKAFEERQKILPDHEMLNAALGIYDEKRVKQIQATVRAFRDAYHGFKTAVEKAKTVKAVEALEPEFPTELVSPKGER